MILLHYAVDEGEVDFLDAAGGELLGEIAMRGVGFGDQQHAAGIAVQAMHDAGTQRAALRRERAEAVQQRVHQRPGANASAGVHDHARGLVDCHHVGVLIENREREIFRSGVERSGCGRLDIHHIVFAQRVRRAGGASID